MHFRKLTADTICAPRRGKPPAAPEGFTQDLTDPYLYHLTLEPCESREIRIFHRPCCGKVARMWCLISDTMVRPWGCKNRCPKDEC